MIAQRRQPTVTLGNPAMGERSGDSRPPLARWLVFTFAAVLFLFQLGRHDLTASHEARAAQNAQRMLDDGAFGLPTLFDGQVDLQKPPGYYWLVALVSAADGVTPFTARLPAAIAGLISVLAVYVLVRRLSDETTAVVAALVLATAVHFTALARIARIDMPLTAAVSLSLLLLLRGCESPRSLRWWIAAGIAGGASVLLKGPIGLALIGATASAILLIERTGWKQSLAALSVLSAVAILLALPWFLWANAQTGGEFLRVFVWHHNVARFLGTAPTLAAHPWWYYLPRFAADFLPWTPSFVFLTWWGFRSGLWHDRAFRLGLVWFAAMTLVLSASRFKRADYLLPSYPGAAIALASAALAWYRSRNLERSRTLLKYGMAGFLGLTLLGWQVYTFAIEPSLDAKDEKRAFAEAIRREAPRPKLILMFRVESHLLAFHLGRPLHTLVEWGELNDRLNQPGPHDIVTQPIYAEEVKAILPHHRLEVVATLEDFTQAAPPRPLVYLRKSD